MFIENSFVSAPANCALVEPIHKPLSYNEVGKKLLGIELPQGALARYERDVAAIAHIVGRRRGPIDPYERFERLDFS